MSTVTEVTELGLHQLLGPGAATALAEAGLPCPEAEQSAAGYEAGFIARLGNEHFLVADETGWAPPEAGPPWPFPRADLVLRLTGAWAETLRELCPHDPGRLPPEGWLMAAVARVNVWLYRPAGSDALLIGCDPSYGRYLQTTLEAAAEPRAPTRHD